LLAPIFFLKFEYFLDETTHKLVCVNVLQKGKKINQFKQTDHNRFDYIGLSKYISGLIKEHIHGVDTSVNKLCSTHQEDRIGFRRIGKNIAMTIIFNEDEQPKIDQIINQVYQILAYSQSQL